MNLYKLHTQPHKLLFREKVTDRNPEIFYNLYSSKPEELAKREKYIALSPEYASRYARFILKGPFPAGEAAIATNAETAFNYALFVLEGPFPKGEDAIAKDADRACSYASSVLNGPFPKGEVAIAKDALS